MTGQLTAFQPVGHAAGAAALLETFAADPVVWLPLPASPAGTGWVIRLYAGPVSATALCEVGPVWQDGHALWRRLTWQPADDSGQPRVLDAALPRFAGDLGLLRHSGLTLVLTGTYRPPGGTVGAVADRLGLERVAGGTARRWLADLARRVSPEHHHTAVPADVALR